MTSWRSLFSSGLIRLLHGWIDGCLCCCGWSRRSSRSSGSGSGSCAGGSTVLGHDTDILCLSSLPAGLLGLHHLCFCLQSGRKFIGTSVVRGFSESSRDRSWGLRLGPEKKAEFTKSDKTPVVGGKYLYGNSSLCQAYRKEEKEASCRCCSPGSAAPMGPKVRP